MAPAPPRQPAAPRHRPGTRPPRRRILDAAEQVVLRDGVGHLTLEAAAAEAGLSKGGVLYHFPTRDALVAGMVDQDHRGVRARTSHLRLDRADRPTARVVSPAPTSRATMEPELPPARRGGPAGRRPASPPRRPSRPCWSPSRRPPTAGRHRLERRRTGPGRGHRVAPGLRRPVAVRPVRPGPADGGPARPGGPGLRTMTGQRDVIAAAARHHAPPPTDASRRLIRTLTAHRLPRSGWGPRRSSPCCRSTSATWGEPTPWPGVVMASFFAAGVLSQYPHRPAGRPHRAPAGAPRPAWSSTAWPASPSCCPSPPPVAIGLRGPPGRGGRARPRWPRLAMVSGSVAVERRGRAFASIYGGEIWPAWPSARWWAASSASTTCGPCSSASGWSSFGACIPALAHRRAPTMRPEPVPPARVPDGTMRPATPGPDGPVDDRCPDLPGPHSA